MIGISNFKNIITGDIAIDLGTANTQFGSRVRVLS